MHHILGLRCMNRMSNVFNIGHTDLRMRCKRFKNSNMPIFRQMANYGHQFVGNSPNEISAGKSTALLSINVI